MSAVPERVLPSERVVIAIDPHKASWTAAVVDASPQPVATIRVPVSRDGYRQLRRFASRWPDADLGNRRRIGPGCAADRAATHRRDRRPRRSRQTRRPSTDAVDRPRPQERRRRRAVSVGIAARSARRLNSVAVDGAVDRPARDRRTPRRPGQNPHPNRQPPPRRAHQTHPRQAPTVNSQPSGPPNSCAGSAPRYSRQDPARASPSIWSPRYASWTGASPKPPPTSSTAVTASGTTLTELFGIGCVDRGQDPRPGRHDRPIPLRRRVRHLHRNRPDRRVLRRRCPPQALPRRRPTTQPAAFTSWPSPRSGRTPRAGAIT